MAWLGPRALVLAAILALGLGLGLGAGLALSEHGHSARSHSPPTEGWTANRLVPTVPLVDANGRRVTLAAFRGRVLVLTPFLTLCSETCPLTTGAFIRMQRAVDAAGLAQRAAFAEVTIDPARDTPARLRAYERMTGLRFDLLTGSSASLARLWRFLGVGYRRVPQGHPPARDWWTGRPLTYDIEHTDAVFFIDPSGRERRFLVGMPSVGGRLAPALERLLSATGVQNLAHPVGAWTVGQALADLGSLLGRPISESP